MPQRRIRITVKDIAAITGYSLKKSRQLYRQARVKFRKTKKHQLLTYEEFFRFASIPLSQLNEKQFKANTKRKGPRPL